MIRNCNWCGKEYEVDMKEYRRALRNGTLAGHFCSPSCARKHVAEKNKGKKKPNVKCAYCGKPFYKKPSNFTKSKTGLHFCCREHKDRAQRIESGSQFDAMRPDHYQDGSSYYVQRAFEVHGAFCVDCGLDIRALLQVHHIDGDRENGADDNLEVVCLTHHAIRHMRKVNGEWKFSWSYLTPRECLDELRQMHFGQIVHQKLTG